jgi:proline iminopeptidase
MRLRLADGTRLFVEQLSPALAVEGAGLRERRPLLLVHGGPGVADHSSLRPFFSRLADRYAVYAYDQRGHGRSDRSNPARWDLTQWTDDLAQMIRLLGLDQAVIIGQSFGGYVALALAARYPELVGALVLSSTQARRHTERSVAAFERLGGQAAAEAARRFWQDPGAGTLAEYERVCLPLYNTRPRPADLASRTIRNEEVLLRSLRGAGRELDLRALLPAISASCLVIAGAEDPVITPQCSRELASGLSGAARVDYELIADAGHGAFRDQPAEYERVLRSFLERLG